MRRQGGARVFFDPPLEEGAESVDRMMLEPPPPPPQVPLEAALSACVTDEAREALLARDAVERLLPPPDAPMPYVYHGLKVRKRTHTIDRRDGGSETLELEDHDGNVHVVRRNEDGDRLVETQWAEDVQVRFEAGSMVPMKSRGRGRGW